MTTTQFKKKYEAIQKEARAIATELKPIARRYQSLCEKAASLGVSVKYDAQLYRKHDKHGYNEPDGWDINTLSRLDDIDELLLQDARSLLLNLADQPFGKQTTKPKPNQKGMMHGTKRNQSKIRS